MGSIFKKPKAPTYTPPPTPSPIPTPTPEIVSSSTEDARRKMLERRRQGFAMTMKTSTRGIPALDSSNQMGNKVLG